MRELFNNSYFRLSPPPPLLNQSGGSRGDSLDGFKAGAMAAVSPRGNTPHPFKAKSGPSSSGATQSIPGVPGGGGGGGRAVATPSVSNWKMEFDSNKWNKSLDMMGGMGDRPGSSVSKDAMKSSAIGAATNATMHGLNPNLPSTPTHREVGMAQRAGTLRLI